MAQIADMIVTGDITGLRNLPIDKKSTIVRLLEASSRIYNYETVIAYVRDEVDPILYFHVILRDEFAQKHFPRAFELRKMNIKPLTQFDIQELKNTLNKYSN